MRGRNKVSKILMKIQSLSLSLSPFLRLSLCRSLTLSSPFSVCLYICLSVSLPLCIHVYQCKYTQTDRQIYIHTYIQICTRIEKNYHLKAKTDTFPLCYHLQLIIPLHAHYKRAAMSRPSPTAKIPVPQTLFPEIALTQVAF